MVVLALAQATAGEESSAIFEGHTAAEWIRALAQSKLPNEIFGRADSKKPREALRAIGPAAIPAALEAMRDPRGEIRSAAGDVIADLGPAARPALAALLGLVRTGAPGTQVSAAETLARLGPLTREVIPAIVDLLRAPFAGERCAAADALRAIGPEARVALPALREAFKHEEGVARARMALTLARLDPKNPAGQAALIEILGSTRLSPEAPALVAWSPVLRIRASVQTNRIAAAEALGDLGPAATSAVPALIESLQLKEPYRSDFLVQQAAIRALGRIGPGAKQAIPSLLKILGTPTAQEPPLASEALIAIKPDRGVTADLIGVMKQKHPAYLRNGELAAAVFQAVGPDAIPDLIPLLKDPDARLRSLALEALGAIGPASETAIPHAIAGLKDGDAAVRAAAARALGRIGPAAAHDGVAPLATALGDRDPAVAFSAASALAGLGPAAKAARPALLAGLGDRRQEGWRRRLVESLLKIDPDARHDAVLALLGVLKNPDPRTRRDAFFTLAEAIDCRPEKQLVVPVLVEALRSPQPNFAFGAVPLLMKLQAGDVLLPIAQDWLRSSDPVQHLEALRTLSALGPRARTAAPAVRELLKDRDLMIRSGAAAVLLQFDPGAEDAQEVLLAVLEDPNAKPDQKFMVGMPLCKFAIPTRAAVPRLVRCLDDSQPEQVRTTALTALGRSGPAATVATPRMIELLGDRDSWIRRAAAEALGGLGPIAKDAIPALKKIALGGDLTLSGVAADALKKIEKPSDRGS